MRIVVLRSAVPIADTRPAAVVAFQLFGVV
jgi:hypothetical protein